MAERILPGRSAVRGKAEVRTDRALAASDREVSRVGRVRLGLNGELRIDGGKGGERRLEVHWVYGGEGDFRPPRRRARPMRTP